MALFAFCLSISHHPCNITLNPFGPFHCSLLAMCFWMKLHTLFFILSCQCYRQTLLSMITSRTHGLRVLYYSFTGAYTAWFGIVAAPESRVLLWRDALWFANEGSSPVITCMRPAGEAIRATLFKWSMQNTTHFILPSTRQSFAVPGSFKELSPHPRGAAQLKDWVGKRLWEQIIETSPFI